MKTLFTFSFVLYSLNSIAQYTLSYGVKPNYGGSGITFLKYANDSTFESTIDPNGLSSYRRVDFYNGYRNYPQTRSQHENLLRAVNLKIQSELIQNTVDSLDSVLTVKLIAETDVDKIGIIKKEYRALMDEQIENKNKIYKEAVEYYVLFRGDRAIQLFPAGVHDCAVRAELFYENQVRQKSNKMLGSFLITSGGNGNLAAFTELYSDYFGPFRLGVGTMISSNPKIVKDTSELILVDSSERKEDAIQRIVGGGGNFVGNLDYPLLYIKTGMERFRFLSSLNLRGAIDAPSVGTYSSDFLLKFDPGISSSLFIDGYRGEIVFFATNRFSYLMGNSKFQEYIAVERGLWVNQVAVGFAFRSMFRVGANLYFGSSYIKDNFPTTIFVALIPK